MSGEGAEPPAALSHAAARTPRRRAIGLCPGSRGPKHPRGRNRPGVAPVRDAASMPARRARASPSEGPPIPRARRLALAAALALAAGLAVSATASALPYVAVDPGHGGGDTGAVGELPPGAVTGLPPRADAQGRPVLLEKDVNLDIGLRLDGYLRGRGARTILTRTTGPRRRRPPLHHRDRRPARAGGHRQRGRRRAVRVDPQQRPEPHRQRQRDLPLLLRRARRRGCSRRTCRPSWSPRSACRTAASRARASTSCATPSCPPCWSRGRS